MKWTYDLRGLVLTIYSIILITGLPGNLLSLYVLIRKVKQEAKPIDMLLLSLNISDLIFLISLPIRYKEAADMEWKMSHFLCPLATYIFAINFYNSTLLLMAISVERYLGVIFAIRYKLKRHLRHTIITSVIIWVVNMAHCSIVLYLQYNYSDKSNAGVDLTNQTSCYWNFTQEQLKILLPGRLGVSILGIFIPVIICCFCYISIILRLSQADNIKPMKRCRAIGLAISTLLVFMICFVPLGVSFVVGFIGWYSPWWRVYVMLFSSFNACLDPFVLYFSSKLVQKTFKDCARSFFMWLQLLQLRLNLKISNSNSSDQIHLQMT